MKKVTELFLNSSVTFYFFQIYHDKESQEVYVQKNFHDDWLINSSISTIKVLFHSFTAGFLFNKGSKFFPLSK